MWRAFAVVGLREEGADRASEERELVGAPGGPPLVVGSGAGCSLAVAHPDVAERHVSVDVDPVNAYWKVYACPEPRAQTLLNGVPLYGPQPLHAGDVLTRQAPAPQDPRLCDARDADAGASGGATERRALRREGCEGREGSGRGGAKAAPAAAAAAGDEEKKEKAAAPRRKRKRPLIDQKSYQESFFLTQHMSKTRQRKPVERTCLK
eukprot:m51a1_g14372 hypothetical protein (207) ;mRNA; f:255440-256940